MGHKGERRTDQTGSWRVQESLRDVLEQFAWKRRHLCVDKMVRRDIWAQGWGHWCTWELVRWTGWVLVRSVQLECVGCWGVAGDEVTDSSRKHKRSTGQLKEFGIDSVCFRKTLHGKLRNDPVPFAFYEDRYQLCGGRPAYLIQSWFTIENTDPKETRSWKPHLPTHLMQLSSHSATCFSEDPHRYTHWALTSIY